MNTEQTKEFSVFPVKLTMSSRHVLPQMGSGSHSMFSAGNNPQPAKTEPAFPVELDDDTKSQIQDLIDEYELQEGESPEDVMDEIESMFQALFQSVEPTEDNSNRFLMTTEGILEVDETEYRLKYLENPENGFGEAQTILHIQKNEPTVIIERSGTLMSTLYCEKGKRHISNYTSPMMPMPFSVCIYTRKCESTITENGGVLLLDYLVELRGADIQRTTMRINVTVLDPM